MGKRRYDPRTSCIALVLLFTLFGSYGYPQVPPKKKPPPASAHPQPRLIALPVKKCVECGTSLRKRLAVMPVKVGTLPTELSLSPESVAQKLRDELEQAVSKQDGIIAVNRADLNAILDEQTLAQKGMTHKEISPAGGKLIPAQLLLFATVGSIDVSTESERQSSDDAVGLEREAEDKEREASDLERNATDMATAYRAGDAQLRNLYQRRNAISAECSRATNFAAAMNCALQLQEINGAIANMEQGQGNTMQAFLNNKGLAQQRRDEARELHTKARFESQKEATETRTATLTASIIWRVVDTSFGTVVGSGTTSQSESSTQEGVTVKTASTFSQKSRSVRYDALVNAAVSQAVDKLASEVDTRVQNQPFRAKIVKVEPAGVVLNCGSNLGVSVGDAFGVQEKREILRDPDTGMPLEKPGPPVGVIRVSQVFDATSFAQVVKAAGILKRGDELTWIGVYTVDGGR
jgi:hypothetical protein